MKKADKARGRVTIPTDVDVVDATLALMKRWGADALRDCDGTDFPMALREVGAKVYSTYNTTRKDNEEISNRESSLRYEFPCDESPRATRYSVHDKVVHRLATALV